MSDDGISLILAQLKAIREQIDRMEANLHPSIYRPEDRSEAERRQALKVSEEVER